MERPTWDLPAVMPICGSIGVDAKPVYVTLEKGAPSCLYAVVFSTEEKLRAATKAFGLVYERVASLGALAAAFAIVPVAHDGLDVHLAFDLDPLGKGFECVRIRRDQCPAILWSMPIAGLA